MESQHVQKPWNLGLKPPKPVQNADETTFFWLFVDAKVWMRVNLRARLVPRNADVLIWSQHPMNSSKHVLHVHWDSWPTPMLVYIFDVSSWILLILGTRHVKHQMIFKVHSSPMCVEQRDITRPFQFGCNSRILEGFWRGCLLGATMATWHGLPIARCPAEHVSGPGSTNRSHQRQKSEKHWGSWRF